jgi:Domain of unknown function (DUF4304)
MAVPRLADIRERGTAIVGSRGFGRSAGREFGDDVVHGISERFLLMVDPGRWDPVRQPVEHHSAPASAFERGSGNRRRVPCCRSRSVTRPHCDLRRTGMGVLLDSPAVEASGTTPREAMNAALKEVIGADLRPRGFTGSLPHLRRSAADQISLVTFQFHSSGGSFVVEVAECGPNGYTTSWGAHKPPQKVTAHDVSDPRPRLGSATFPAGDHWFTFGSRNYETGSNVLRSRNHYAKIASQVVQFIDSQAEPFWRQRLAVRASTT